MAKASSVAARRREHWRRLVSQWQASGISQTQFCRRRRIPVWKFAWWKKRLRLGRVVRGPSFVPLRVVASPPSAELELGLRGGRVLRFAVDVETAKLAAIVSALEASCRETPTC